MPTDALPFRLFQHARPHYAGRGSKGLRMGANSFRTPPGASGRFQGAEAAYGDALQLATDFPNVPDYENELALTLSNLGWLANA